MKFSIIVPVYNAERYVKECLESVLAQTVQDWECICVDDGSTDGSGAILDEYAAKDVRFRVIHKSNEGVAVARNTGLERAIGEYICFVDADDTVDTNWLQVYADCIDENDYDIVMIAPNEKVRISREISDAKELKDWGWNYLAEWGCPWVYSVKRKIAIRARFPRGVKFCEDSLYVMQLVPHFRKARQVPVAPYHYRVVAGSAGKAKLYSYERLLYLNALWRVREKIPDISRRMYSNAALGGALCWGSRPKDFEHAKEIHELVKQTYSMGLIDFSLLRRPMKVVGWIYIKTAWTWPIRLQDWMMRQAAKVKWLLRRITGKCT